MTFECCSDTCLNHIVKQLYTLSSSNLLQLIHDLQELAQSSWPDPTEDAMESDQEGMQNGKKFVKGVFQDRYDMNAKFAKPVD